MLSPMPSPSEDHSYMNATEQIPHSHAFLSADSIEVLQRLIARRADLLRARLPESTHSDLECWLLAEEEILPSADTESLLIAV